VYQHNYKKTLPKTLVGGFLRWEFGKVERSQRVILDIGLKRQNEKYPIK
tara:strand:+ start:415 stop:561 length:147 start_codon:yes stop_codon:yes gene_type:complete